MWNQQIKQMTKVLEQTTVWRNFRETSTALRDFLSGLVLLAEQVA